MDTTTEPQDSTLPDACETCGSPLDETDNVIGRWCDDVCADFGCECEECGEVSRYCACDDYDRD